MAKSPKNRQEIITTLEDLVIKSAVNGTTTQAQCVDLWIEKLHSDTTLLGFDFRGHAQSDVERLFASRYPDWSRPVFKCFADGLWIPFNKEGGKVMLLWATDEHWDAHDVIMEENNKNQNLSFRDYKDKDTWHRAHRQPHYKNLGDMLRDNQPKKKGL
jgi:hypothetical protein